MFRSSLLQCLFGPLTNLTSITLPGRRVVILAEAVITLPTCARMSLLPVLRFPLRVLIPKRGTVRPSTRLQGPQEPPTVAVAGIIITWLIPRATPSFDTIILLSVIDRLPKTTLFTRIAFRGASTITRLLMQLTQESSNRKLELVAVSKVNPFPLLAASLAMNEELGKETRVIPINLIGWPRLLITALPIPIARVVVVKSFNRYMTVTIRTPPTNVGAQSPLPKVDLTTVPTLLDERALPPAYLPLSLLETLNMEL